MSTSRYSTPRDNKGRMPIPDSATKPFPRVHSRNRNRNSDDTITHGAKDKLQAGLDKRLKDTGKARNEEKNKTINAKGAAPRNSFSSDDDDYKQRAGGKMKGEKNKTLNAKGATTRRSSSSDDDHKPQAGDRVKGEKSKQVKAKGATTKRSSSSSDDDHKPQAGGRVKGEKSKQVKAKGATTKRSSSSSDSDERSGRTRVRSPIECQCSCHKEGGRRRSPSRDARSRKNKSVDRRSSLDSIHGRFGKSAFSEASDSRTNSGKSTDDGPYRNGYKSGGASDDGDDNRRNRMPPININDSEARKKGKGGFTKNTRDPATVYKPRVDSKTSQLSVTSVNSKGGSKNNKEPFRYYGRSHSAGSVTNFGGTSNQYDYAHEDFLTPRFTSEYQARYEMKMGQRYKVLPDKSIHFIDPAGQHILVPKGDSKQLMQRRNSDSDIAKNNNIKLEPLNAKAPTDPSQGGAKKWVGNSTHVEQGGPRGRPGAEGRVVAPTGGGPPKRPALHSLPPMQRMPSIPQGSDAGKALSAREETAHPLGLNSPPKRRTQLQPM